MVGGPVGHPIRQLPMGLLAQGLDHLAGIDAHRAQGRAQAIGGAGVHALVAVGTHQPFQRRLAPAADHPPADLAPSGDPLPGREGQVFGRADRFAEPALDALVHQLVGGRQRLEILDVGFQVAVDDHPGVQQPLGIEQVLDRLHQPEGRLAPLLLDKGGHVAAGAVFRLEGAVVFLQHHFDHVVHQVAVAHHLGLGGKILGEDEVEIAGQGVAEDDGLGVLVAKEEFLQVEGGVGKVFDGEGHVLDDHRGAGPADRAHRREQPLADLPQLVEFLGDGGELDGPDRGHTGEGRPDLRYLRLQGCGGLGPGFHQHGGHPRAQFAQELGHARLAGDRGQAGPVHQFGGGHRLFSQDNGRLAGRADVGEVHQGAGLVAMLDNRAVDDLGDEPEGAFGADQQVLQDLEGILEIDQGVQTVAGGVLDLELVADALGQFVVGQHSLAQRGQAVEQVAVAAAEGGPALVVGGVHHRAVGQDEAHRIQRAVAVLLHPAAHAAGVVGEDAADLGAVDGGRVRADLAVELGEDAVGVTADHARLQADPVGLVKDPEVGPAPAQAHQDGIRDRLAGQAGAGGPEGDRQFQPARFPEDALHLEFVLDIDDDFRNEPVKTGIRAVGDGPERIDDEPVSGNGGLDAAKKFSIFSGQHGAPPGSRNRDVGWQNIR